MLITVVCGNVFNLKVFCPQTNNDVQEGDGQRGWRQFTEFTRRE